MTWHGHSSLGWITSRHFSDGQGCALALLRSEVDYIVQLRDGSKNRGSLVGNPGSRGTGVGVRFLLRPVWTDEEGSRPITLFPPPNHPKTGQIPFKNRKKPLEPAPNRQRCGNETTLHRPCTGCSVASFPFIDHEKFSSTRNRQTLHPASVTTLEIPSCTQFIPDASHLLSTDCFAGTPTPE